MREAHHDRKRALFYSYCSPDNDAGLWTDHARWRLGTQVPRRPAGSHPRSTAWRLYRPANQRERAGVCRQLGRLATDHSRTSMQGPRRVLHVPWPSGLAHLGREGPGDAASHRDQAVHQHVRAGAPSGWMGVPTRRSRPPHWMGFSTAGGKRCAGATTHLKSSGSTQRHRHSEGHVVE